MSSSSRRQLEDWLKTIEVRVEKVLDIGGAQLPVKGRTKSWEVGEYRILDLPKPHEQKIEIDYKIDIQDTVNIWAMKIQKFDVVFCLEVSEYWINPAKALENIKLFMNEGAILYISFHFIYPLHKPTEKDLMRYTKYGVMELLKNAGFKILKMESRLSNHPGLLFDYFYKEGMRMDRTEDYEELTATGYLIKAEKI